MEKNKKKHYVTPSMKVYEIEPTQLLNASTSVNEWQNGGNIGAHEI